MGLSDEEAETLQRILEENLERVKLARRVEQVMVKLIRKPHKPTDEAAKPPQIMVEPGLWEEATEEELKALEEGRIPDTWMFVAQHGKVPVPEEYETKGKAPGPPKEAPEEDRPKPGESQAAGGPRTHPTRFGAIHGAPSCSKCGGKK